MKKSSLASCLLLVTIILGASMPNYAYAEIPKGRFWAVVIAGEAGFVYETDLVCEILTKYYNFNDNNIYYITPYIDALCPVMKKSGVVVDARLSIDNVRSAFTVWLRQRSTPTDTVFIYIVAHGGGFRLSQNSIWRGRKDEDGDEGPEIHESHYGQDVNGDGDKDDWFGVDECIILNPYSSSAVPVRSYYWDDELASDLSTVSYWRLIFVYIGARNLDDPNPDNHCFSGGFIDDLSAPNRILIAPSNETSPALGRNIAQGDPLNLQFGVLSFFGEQFLSALNKSAPAFTEADVNNDGRVSILEAYQYAYEHDPTVEGCVYPPIYGSFAQETPWLDDNGNGLPTFMYGEDWLDEEEGEMADGYLAAHTFLDKPWSTDVNGDGIVGILDIEQATGSHWLSTRWKGEYNPNADLDGNGIINILDLAMIGRDWGKTV